MEPMTALVIAHLPGLTEHALGALPPIPAEHRLPPPRGPARSV